jgi:hypothetical protein
LASVQFWFFEDYFAFLQFSSASQLPTAATGNLDSPSYSTIIIIIILTRAQVKLQLGRQTYYRLQISCFPSCVANDADAEATTANRVFIFGKKNGVLFRLGEYKNCSDKPTIDCPSH